MNELTIIIPIYNTEKYLKKCLDSIKEMTFPIKVILVDDGSTDLSGKIADEYACKDNRFSVIHQKNMGLVKARNTGINAVKSEFFTFVDSDDYIDAVKYSDMLNSNFSKFIEADMVCTGMVEEYQENCYTKVNKYSDGMYTGLELYKIYESMLSYGDFFDFGILPNTVCKIYRTDFVKKSFYNISPNVSIGEDADMTYQLMLKAKAVYILNETPYHYYRHEGTMMWKKVEGKIIHSLEKDLKTAFLQYEDLKKILLPQLEEYMNFVHLLCDPEVILSRLEFFSSDKERIALYGAGGVGRAVINNLKNNFTLWVDKKYNLYKYDNVLPTESLMQKEDCYDKIFIAISNVKICRQIRQELIDKGIDKPIYYFGMNEDDYK